MSDLPHLMLRVVNLEDLTSLFPEEDFDDFLDHLSYTWSVDEDEDDEASDCALMVTKDWLMRRACDFGVTEDTLQGLEESIDPNVLVQIDRPYFEQHNMDYMER